MNILFENPDKVNGLMTVTVEEADFKDDVEKTLKDYRKKANFPGFRPGMVPMGLIKKQFGASVKMDTLNKFVGEKIYTYIKDNKIQMLGEPLPSEKQEPVDIEKDGPYTFMFDIAVAPEFKIELNGDTKLAYYNIKADDKLIDQQVDMFASQLGSYEKADSYDGEQRDMLKGDLRELDADGNTKEGGITVDGAVMMPEYIKVEDQKKLFDNAKPGDIIAFNPRKAYPDNDAEVASLLKIDREAVKSMDSDFSYQVIEISRFKKAEVNQEMFDHVFGKDAVKSEEEFRARIAEGLKPQLQANSDYKFLIDLRKVMMEKVGKLEFPDALLKRIMLANNADKGEKFVEENYDKSIEELTWHLIKEQLVKANNIKVEQEDITNMAKESTRAQFAMYGMLNVPDELLDNYAKEMLKKKESIEGLVNRVVESKLAAAVKPQVTLEHKSISAADFNKMFE